MNINDLAIFGGSPTFEQPCHVGRPNIGNQARFLERVHDILDRRWLTNNGPLVQDFEKAVADISGVKHCIASCNGTVALEIAIRAAGLRGEVIIPSFTFIATAHALQWQEITPVFCDVDDNHNLDPQQVERLITPRTTGIIGVHVWGRPCNVDALEEIAARHRLTLLFDAAHAFGCSLHGEKVGSFGTAEVFSFHATKFVNAFEGGAIVTNDDALAARARSMTNFGFSGYDLVTAVGTNGKMSEISAAMGLTSLEAMDSFVAHNRALYRQYQQELSGLPGVKLIQYDEREHNNFQYVVLDVDEEVAGIQRDQAVAVLHAENILARRYFFPGCHKQEPYRSYYPHAGLLLPQTEALTQRVLALPTGTAMCDKDVASVCAVVRSVFSRGAEIAERLSASNSNSAVVFVPGMQGGVAPSAALKP